MANSQQPNIYMRQLPGNSISQRTQAASQTPAQKPVISGATQRVVKKSEGFLAESGKAVWNSVLTGVIVPNIKRVIDEVFTSALRGALYGSQTQTQNRNTLPFTPRTSYPTRYSQPVNQYQRPTSYFAQAPQGYDGAQEGATDLGEIQVQSVQDADALLQAAQGYIREYGEISVCKLAEMAGLQAPYTGNEWGYYTMRGAEKIRRNDQWSIRLPAPIHLKQQ